MKKLFKKPLETTIFKKRELVMLMLNSMLPKTVLNNVPPNAMNMNSNTKITSQKEQRKSESSRMFKISSLLS